MKEELNKPLYERLTSGEEVICEECGKGYLMPFNTIPQKAHCFICSNCNNRYCWEPFVDIQ